MHFLQSVRPFLLSVFFALSLFPILLFFEDSNTLEVHFFDVGQGDSAFIETSSGIQILIDAGADRSVLRHLGRVMDFHDRHIDIIIATHPDKDHIGGIPDILKRYDVSLLLEPGIESDIGEYQFIEASGVERLIVDRPMYLYLEDDIILEILFPDRDLSKLEKNAGSIIAQLRYGEHEFLFMGDAPKSIEKFLVSKYGDRLKSDVLKVGHHGSKTSSDELFIEMVDPVYAIISADENNRYGHPHQEVLDALDGIEILKTHEDEIVFISDGVHLQKK